MTNRWAQFELLSLPGHPFLKCSAISSESSHHLRWPFHQATATHRMLGRRPFNRLLGRRPFNRLLWVRASDKLLLDGRENCQTANWATVNRRSSFGTMNRWDWWWEASIGHSECTRSVEHRSSTSRRNPLHALLRSESNQQTVSRRTSIRNDGP